LRVAYQDVSLVVIITNSDNFFKVVLFSYIIYYITFLEISS
jgi:hypothetical protein